MSAAPEDSPSDLAVDTVPDEKVFRWDSIVWAGISLAAIFWFGESLIHVIFFDERFFLLPTEPNEVWMRGFVCVLLVGFGFYSDTVLRRYRKVQRERLLLEQKLSAALEKVLGGYIPICAHCKRIRDEEGRWTQLENHVRDRTAADFTHSICPKCIKKYYGNPDNLGAG